MTAELWLHRPCVHGHEGSWRTHPPVAAMLSGDESPCEGGRPRVRLDPDKVERIQVSGASGSYGPKHVIDSSDLVFVDMDYEMATTLAPGTYLVIGIDALEEE